MKLESNANFYNKTYKNYMSFNLFEQQQYGFIGKNQSLSLQNNKSDKISLSDNAKNLLKDVQDKIKEAKQEYENETNKAIDEKTYVTAKILKAIFGKEINVTNTIDIDKEFEEQNKNIQDNKDESQYEYYYSKKYYEYEEVNFNASGVISTSDGHEIEFDLNLKIEKYHYYEESYYFRGGKNLSYPLKIDYEGTSDQLSDSKFLFESDSNSINENFPFMKSGMGILLFNK